MNYTHIKNFIITTISCITLFTISALAEIVEIPSIDSPKVQEILNIVDKDTLVLIDIDYTLVIPKAKIFSSPNSPYASLINSLITYSKKSRYYDTALENWYSNRKLQLVEDTWPKMIEDLKSKGATVLGFADMDDTWYSLIEEPELVRYKELKELGINFTNTVMNKELFRIEANGNRQAIFYYGIIFNGPFSKAEALLKFLKVTSLMPTKIIIFEHNKSYLKHIDHALVPLNIKSWEFNYQGLGKFNKIYPDPEIMELQKKALLEDNKWIEDDEAEELFKQVENSQNQPK